MYVSGATYLKYIENVLHGMVAYTYNCRFVHWLYILYILMGDILVTFSWDMSINFLQLYVEY